MPPTFYFAWGRNPTLRDIDVTFAVGQRHFMVPVCSPASRHLINFPNVHVVLDSAAWPPGNPRRPSFSTWLQSIKWWYNHTIAYDPPGSCYERPVHRAEGPHLDYVIAYDHIGDPGQTQRDYWQLWRTTLWDDFPSLPLVRVLQYPCNADMTLAELRHAPVPMQFDQVDLGPDLLRPAYAIGGLVPVNGTLQARDWLCQFLDTFQAATEPGDDDDLDWPVLREFVTVHLLGIARPDMVNHPSGLVTACDSAGPAIRAGAGWQEIAPSYTDAYGLSPELLKRNRFARVAYWLCRYRDRLHLPWQRVEPVWLDELTQQHPAVLPEQLAMDLL